MRSRTKAFLLILLASIPSVFAPSAVSASEKGTVLILGADCVDGRCMVNSYGSGFVVKSDTTRNTAYIVTARHVVHGFDRIYLLYDRLSFPSEYAFELDEGTIPPPIATTLTDRGHPTPTSLRSGLPFSGDEPARGERIELPVESWILSGQARDYLALPQTVNLELFQLLQAELVRESNAEFDVALLVVNDFPDEALPPVHYIVTPDSIDTGAKVLTSGCDCGIDTGIAQADVQGTVASNEGGFLSYESGLVRPGFSGGPVLVDGHVVAMNLAQDLTTGSRIRARLASTFKSLVDGWIGLPRMRVDVEIDSPPGARDGVVSTNQGFAVRATAREDPEGQVLAPVTKVSLDVPMRYEAESEAVGSLVLGQEKEWFVRSPMETTEREEIRLHEAESAPGSDARILASTHVRTEEGARLIGRVVECPASGGTLFRGDEFSIAVEFGGSGQPITGLDGDASIDVEAYLFEILDGGRAQPIEVDRPIRWKLKANEAAKLAPIQFAAEVRSLDRNDGVIAVEAPAPLGYRIEEQWKFTFVTAAGVYGDGGDVAGTMEIGAKFRLGNIAKKGIPLQLIVSTGVGIDDTWLRDSVDPVNLESTEALIMDWRALAGVGLSAGFGFPEVCVEFGYVWWDRYVDSEAFADVRERYEIDLKDSAFLGAGVDFGLASMLSIYTGSRYYLDRDDGLEENGEEASTEFVVQLRFRNGK